MSITLLTNIGNVGTTGQTVSIDPSIEADLVRRGAAQYVSQVGLNIDPVVRAVSNPVTGGITKIWTGTQVQYDAIATPADDTLYIIVEA